MPDLHSRPAGYEVMRACLDIQRQTRPRSALARFFGVSPLDADAVPWYQGSLGEIRVGQLLARLGPEWTVLHSIRFGQRGSDIDHLVIGPPGVFVLNTKRHRAKRVWVSEHRLLVSGQKTDHLRNSLGEAKRASQALGTAVTPVLVIVAASDITYRGQRGSRPDVVSDTQLLRYLKRGRRTLSPEQINTLVDVAARPQTWSNLQSPALEHSLPQDFAVLQSEEERARRVRLAWAGLALAVILVAAGWVATQFLPGVFARFAAN